MCVCVIHRAIVNVHVVKFQSLLLKKNVNDSGHKLLNMLNMTDICFIVNVVLKEWCIALFLINSNDV